MQLFEPIDSIEENNRPIMFNQETIDLYIKAVEFAKDKDGLGNQDKLLLNRFKILLRSGSPSDADREMALMGKVRKKTLHGIRELAEGIFEDWVRNLKIIDAECEMMLEEGKKRADIAEECLLNELRSQGLVIDN